MNRLRRELLGQLVVLPGVLLVATPAAAEVTRAECVAANTTGQSLRRQGKFAEARQQLRVCNDPACPAVVAEDCTRRLDELDTAQPAILFDAKDGRGHDLLRVVVTMDGRPFADRLDGTPLQVDRGEHTFTFSVPGETPVTETLVIKESEKSRLYTVVIGQPRSLAPQPPVSDPQPEPAPAGGLGRRQWVALAIGGAGAGALVVGSVFGVLTATGIKHQNQDCPSSLACLDPTRAAADHAAWTTDSAVSTAAFVAGGALIAGGAALFFTGHRPSTRTATTGLVVTPGVVPRGGALLLRGEF